MSPFGSRSIKKSGAEDDSAPILLGKDNAYGQHFTVATSDAPWAECFIGSAPGIPLADVARVGQAVPEGDFFGLLGNRYFAWIV